MKYAVMSDAHANPKALSAALEDARGRDCGKFIFLGDLTGYGYGVKETMNLVRGGFDIVLMGNHDSACLGLEPWFDRFMNKNYRQDLKHRDELSDEELEWLGKRPYMHEEGDAAFVHGDYTAPREWNYILGPGEILGNFFACPKQVLFCGHTHLAEIWELDPGGAVRPKFADEVATPSPRPESLKLRLREGCRYIVNAGSVGYPRNDRCSTYAVYDDEARTVALRRLPFDLAGYAADLESGGIAIPPWLASRLEAAKKESGGGANGPGI